MPTRRATPQGAPADVAYDQWVIRFRAALIGALGLLVAGIASIAYLVSFEAISLYAMRSGGIAPKYGWAAPLLVDSFIAVATGADLWFAIGSSQRRWWELAWPKLLLAGAAVVSFILNIAHARHTWPARGVAALAPAALVLSVELLMLVVRRAAALRAMRFDPAMGAPAATGRRGGPVAGNATQAHADPDRFPPGTAADHPPAVAASPRQPPSSRRRLSDNEMRRARTIAQDVFAQRRGRLTGPALRAVLLDHGLPVSERACFGLLRRLRDQLPIGADTPARNGQSELEQHHLAMLPAPAAPAAPAAASRGSSKPPTQRHAPEP